MAERVELSEWPERYFNFKISRRHFFSQKVFSHWVSTYPCENVFLSFSSSENLGTRKSRMETLEKLSRKLERRPLQVEHVLRNRVTVWSSEGLVATKIGTLKLIRCFRITCSRLEKKFMSQNSFDSILNTRTLAKRSFFVRTFFSIERLEAFETINGRFTYQPVGKGTWRANEK